jgi:dsRNA-specific ribonuclease
MRIHFMKFRSCCYEALKENGAWWFSHDNIETIENFFLKHFEQQYIEITKLDIFEDKHACFWIEFSRAEDEAFFQILTADGIEI